MKSKSVYICNECGYQSPKWLGKCPGCNNWNTFVETVQTPQAQTSSKQPAMQSTKNRPQQIGDVTHTTKTRFSTGLGELDRVLGGGVVAGELILVG